MADRDINMQEFPKNLDELCRTCLTRAPVLRNIFYTIGTEPLIHKIMSLTTVQIVQGDGLPSKICTACAAMLNASYEFKLGIENADGTLKRFMEKQVPFVKEEIILTDSECRYDDTDSKQSFHFPPDENKLGDVPQKIRDEDNFPNPPEYQDDNLELSSIDNLTLPKGIKAHNVYMALSEMQNNGPKLSPHNNTKFSSVLDISNNDAKGLSNDSDFKFSSVLNISVGNSQPNQNTLKRSKSPKPLQSSKVNRVMSANCFMANNRNSYVDATSQFKNEKFQLSSLSYSSKELPESNGNASEKLGLPVTSQSKIQKLERSMSPNHVKEKLYKCTHCNKEYAYEAFYERHLKTHLTNKEGTNASNSFMDWNNSEPDIAAKKKQKTLCQAEKLNKCIGAFSNPNFLCKQEPSEDFLYKRTFSSPNFMKTEHECLLCNIAFDSRRTLLNHNRLIHRGKDISHELNLNLGTLTTEEQAMSSTQNSCSDYAGLECDVCYKVYSSRKSLLHHQKSHKTKSSKLPCEICNQLYNKKTQLRSHVIQCCKKHFANHKSLACKICKREFENYKDFSDHKISEGDTLWKPCRSKAKEHGNLECVHCKKKFSNRKKLITHLAIHEGEKYMCVYCSKTLRGKNNLKDHMKSHDKTKTFKCGKGNEKNYLCEICSKSFVLYNSLVAHLRQHSGTKPYVCNVCSRPFASVSYLSMHKRTHSTHKPYVCQYCAKGFGRSNTLQRHLTVHTGEEKYQCKLCSRRFKRLNSMKEHMHTHTGQKPYACEYCNKSFTNNGTRYAHRKRCKQRNSKQPRSTQLKNVISESSLSLTNDA